jgi:hypothetical protein
MAGVHLLPLPDQLTSVAMRALSMSICVGLIFAAAGLLRQLEPRFSWLTLPAALIGIISCTDVMLWAVSGFETVLVTALHLGILRKAIATRRADPWLIVMLSLLPLVRSDGLVIWFGDSCLVMWLANDRRQTAAKLLWTLLPLFGHFAFRTVYYGDLMPNTYYLKLGGLDARWQRGLTYVGGFCERYALVLIFALGTAVSVWRRTPAALSLFTTLLPAMLYATWVGGDSFIPFRFFAYVLPELFIWSAIGAARVVCTPAGRAAWLLGPIGVTALPGLTDPIRHVVPVGDNGMPFEEIVVAAQLLKNASPDASVAVIPAGIVPYFTRLYTVDMLGKTDAHIAHLPPQRGAMVGHGKVDPAYSFAKAPDYVVSVRPRDFTVGITPIAAGTTDYVYTILSSPEFQKEWQPYPIFDSFLLEHSAVYVGATSPERRRVATWKGAAFGPE